MRLGRNLSIAGVMLTLGGVTLGVLGGTTYATSVGPGSTVAIGNPGFSTVGQYCDDYHNGYHFTMNGLEYPAGAVIDAADFGPVSISFSDGSTAVAAFTDVTGGSTAHFLNDTTNQTGNFTVVSAQLTFPAGTDVTGFNQFRISNVPCATTDETTTTESTPPPEGEPTPAPVVFAIPPLPTTTTTTIAPEVQSEAPTPPAALPATGSNSAASAAVLGLFLLGAGLVMSGLSRRPRSL
jgi:LPXTG-motif cell wall-anchored protein